MNAYKKLLVEKGLIDSSSAVDNLKEINVLSVKQTVIDGNTVFFYEVNDGGNTVYYKLSIADDERALFITAGDTILVNATESTQGIYNITYWEFKNA